MSRPEGFISVAAAILISVMAIGLAVTAWYYETKKSEEPKTNVNAVVNNTTNANANTNQTSNVNATITSNSNTNATVSSYCAQDSDCSFDICLGCATKEEAENFVGASLPCRQYEGYSCSCMSNRCITVKDGIPAKGSYDFPTIKTQAECEARGATWVHIGKKSVLCELPAPDAGKACTKLGDCTRECIVTDINGWLERSITYGTCSEFSQGSSRYLDESGELQMILVD